ncbi:hypothetical protein QG070_06415 [Kingella kingae]|uniref:hypothetical protein n=1 Tax=Kingella kingae TaxID=504 RepID=UPI00254E4622|nr:hypothetical protein [Kingella kingae]MDK4650672.1 hypothetical protein [Kingella kingae]
MNFTEMDTLIDSFILGQVRFQDIQYSIRDEVDILEFMKNYLQDGVDNKNGDRVESCIILSSLFKKHQLMLDRYKNILLENWHEQQEDIVDIIGYHSNMTSIPILIKCLDLKYDWLAIDDFYSFHKKIRGCPR